MKLRTLNRLLPAQKVDMDGIQLDQPLPTQGVGQIDPFLLIHHWADTYEGGHRPRELGVAPHPHRGFAPVTFIFKGNVQHRDSRGNNSIIEAGGTQWMDSGMGIVHSERPSKEFAAAGGEFEIIQFWVNLPARHKMDPPSYYPLTAAETPIVSSEDGNVHAGVIAGELNGVKGKIPTHSPMLILRLEVSKGGKMHIPVPENYNALLYLLDGSLKLNDGDRVFGSFLAWFNNDGDSITLEGWEDTRAILLAGEPLNEPVESYGPFVMNNQTEILEAMRDYRMGKMGILIEEFD